MLAELVVVVVVEAFDRCVLDGAVHALDLAIGSGVLDLGQPVLDAVLLAAHVEHVRDEGCGRAFSVARREGELDPVVGEDSVDPVGNCLDQCDEEGRGGDPVGFRLQLDEGEFARAVNGYEEMKLAFGGVRTTTGNPISARFPGQWFQAESGLHQNWMRDYDPTTGRYLQADPLGLVDGASVYGYALQSPMMNVDPRGEDTLPPDPSGLGPDWTPDPSHLDPHGERFRNPAGDFLDFHRGRPGFPGWRGKDHWHHNGEEEHLVPGDLIPGTSPMSCDCDGPVIPAPPNLNPEDMGLLGGIMTGILFVCVWVFAG
jgi:RHS repeat-associated protein